MTDIEDANSSVEDLKAVLSVIGALVVIPILIFNSCETKKHTMFKGNLQGYQVSYEEWKDYNKMILEKDKEKFEFYDNIDFRSITNSDLVDSILERVVCSSEGRKNNREYSISMPHSNSLEELGFRNVISNANVQYNSFRSQIKERLGLQPMQLEAGK